jgi:hypothetical protein
MLIAHEGEQHVSDKHLSPSTETLPYFLHKKGKKIPQQKEALPSAETAPVHHREPLRTAVRLEQLCLNA